jgi:hypothetical protein
MDLLTLVKILGPTWAAAFALAGFFLRVVWMRRNAQTAAETAARRTS